MTSSRESIQKRMGFPVNNEQAHAIRDSLRKLDPRNKVTKMRRREWRGLRARKGELHSRLNSCFNGDESVFDRSFVATHAAEFERPLGGGNGSISITIIDFRE